MNKWIVITTINEPQIAIHSISELCEKEGWNCVVIGDKKTPTGWFSKNITFLSLDDQKKLYPELYALLPFNHYCRKNIGYLYAINKGAEFILETDDDNIPKNSFGKVNNRNIEGRIIGKSKWINVYKYFSNKLIWPRGNPLDSIHDHGEFIEVGEVSSPIQQYLADGDPDVDAIYRLLFKEELFFDNSLPVILERGSWCSFNSQNTLFFKEFFPALYLPCNVSFRMTDIWRSFVAQVVLWSDGKLLSFSSPTVVQVRNQHNLIKDFNDEIIGYTDNRAICAILEDEATRWNTQMSINQKVLSAWQALHNSGYINDAEISILRCWMDYIDEQ